MSVCKCKMCGGTLEIQGNQSVGVCEYCGTKQTLPKLDDERRANMFDRANHFRRSNEFDKAAGIYEQILSEDSSDSESYWGLVLCKYGIEYVEDPVSHKRVPTVNRAQYTSVFTDENYLSAIQNADYYQKSIYEEEAKAIDDIQKGILEISSKEEPFDVFICYKESDESGTRTKDSVYAQEIYYQLVEKGYKVFFARITLESKLGRQYEPYIFAALNSAKVMVIVGTRPEYFNAVWVKNEWSRYLKIAQNKKDRLIIPVYKDMDPYDMPDALSYYQAQDMSKIGFIQDLIRGIEKVVSFNSESKSSSSAPFGGNVSGNNEYSASVSSLLKRGSMALEDSEWDRAYSFFDQVLNLDVENSEAYIGSFLANQKSTSIEDFAKKYKESIRANLKKTTENIPVDNLITELNKYRIQHPKGLDLGINYELYNFDAESSLQTILDNVMSDKNLSKARRVSNDQSEQLLSLKRMVKEEVYSLSNELKEEDDITKQKAQERYKEIEEACKVSIEKEQERKWINYNKCVNIYHSGEYRKVIQNVFSKESKEETITTLLDKFRNLGDYNESQSYYEKLKSEYDELKNELKKKHDELIEEKNRIYEAFRHANMFKRAELEKKLKEVNQALEQMEMEA